MIIWRSGSLYSFHGTCSDEYMRRRADLSVIPVGVVCLRESHSHVFWSSLTQRCAPVLYGRWSGCTVPRSMHCAYLKRLIYCLALYEV